MKNETAVRAENCLLHGLAKSQLESIRLARTSRRFQKLLLDGGDHNEKGVGLPPTLRHLELFESTVDARAVAKQLLPLLPSPDQRLTINDSSTSVYRSQLLTLCLGGCDLDDKDMLTISLALAENRSLHTLRAPKNKVSNMGIKFFCQNWSRDSPLRELNLYHNFIGATGAGLLLQTITQRPAMEILLLNGNPLIGHAGLQMVGAQLPFLHLKHLDMTRSVVTPESETKCTQESTDAARALADGLRGNTSLESLMIGSNNLGSLGAKLIMQAVAVHPTLTRLALAYDQSIGLKGLQHIGKELPNTRLTSLQVDMMTPWPHPETKLARKTGQALLRGVQNCSHLRLFMYDELGPMYMEPIQLCLDLNTTCRPMFSSESATSSALWPHVLAHYGSHGKNSHLYFCLREQPWLMVASCSMEK
jgi:hypothetical protein